MATEPSYYSADVTSTAAERFTDLLWSDIEVVRSSIDSLEFLRRLGDGTLPLDAFRRYVEQDKLYLEGYAKALSLVAAHAPDPQAAGFWSNSASTAATVESALHDGLLSELTAEDQLPYEHTQTCLAYLSYLTATAATQPYAVAAAAVLPCFWIYAEVGRALASSARDVLASDPSHPYARWVTTYDAPEFHESVARAREFVDQAASAATAVDREAMRRSFLAASRYELMFWDSALNPVPWPAS